MREHGRQTTEDESEWTLQARPITVSWNDLVDDAYLLATHDDEDDDPPSCVSIMDPRSDDSLHRNTDDGYTISRLVVVEDHGDQGEGGARGSVGLGGGGLTDVSDWLSVEGTRTNVGTRFGDYESFGRHNHNTVIRSWSSIFLTILIDIVRIHVGIGIIRGVLGFR